MMRALLADRAEQRPGESAMSSAAHHQHLGGMPLHDG